MTEMAERVLRNRRILYEEDSDDENITSSDNESDGGGNSREEVIDEALSDIDDPDAPTEISDIRFVDNEEENAGSSTSSPSDEEPVEMPAEPERGMRYVAQNPKKNYVWWSLPTAQTKINAEVRASTRARTTGVSKFSVESKSAAFKNIMNVIIRKIVVYTNKKAETFYRNCPENIIPRSWHPTTENEMYAFIAIVLYAGKNKSWDESVTQVFCKDNRPFYRACMAQKRFEQLCRFIRFDDSETRPQRRMNDKLAAFREVWTIFNTALDRQYSPSSQLTVDEQLVSLRNRCSFRQYLPSKPGKYGIKIFWLVDSSNSYPLCGDIYLGMQPRQVQKAHHIAMTTVLFLARNYIDKDRNITMDNFFSSIPLGLQLIKHNTTMLGTVRANKPELPHHFTRKEILSRREIGSSVFAYSDDGIFQLVSYKPNKNKNVLVLSSGHAADDIDPITQRPQVIIDYNKTKGGVDTLDQLVRTYKCKRQTNRWPMVLFYNMIDVATYAAYVIYEKVHPEWMPLTSTIRRKTFINGLCLELADDHIKERLVSLSPIPKSIKVATSLLGYQHQELMLPEQRSSSIKQRRCIGCPRSKDLKIRSVCDMCNKPYCKQHLFKICTTCLSAETDDAESGMIEEVEVIEEVEDETAGPSQPKQRRLSDQ